MKFDQPYLSCRESNTQLLRYSLDTRVSYSTSVVVDFQVSERLCLGPGFYYDYLIDYTIGFIIITS